MYRCDSALLLVTAMTRGRMAQMPAKNSHCSFCGAPFAPGAPWPRKCGACGNTSFLNPAPVAVLLGWDPSTSPFWGGAFARGALGRPVLADTTSLMNVGIVVGALAAAALAGKLRFSARGSPLSLVAVVAGGLLLGYGARLAYGCNIGAFFSGVASTSLHGWVWILAAAVGNVIGVRLRPMLRLTDP